MGDDETVLALLSAVSEVERQLIRRETALNPDGGERRTFHGVRILETKDNGSRAPGAYIGVSIHAALVLRQDDGSEATWSSVAINRRDGSGWSVEREVELNESHIGEPAVLAAEELPVVVLPTSMALAGALPGLISELLDQPVPSTPPIPT